MKADGDKLVFGDGTPVKFWGVRLASFPEDEAAIENLANRLSAYGCNIVCSPSDKSLEKAAKIFNVKGIYVLSEMPNKEKGGLDVFGFELGSGLLASIPNNLSTALTAVFGKTPTPGYVLSNEKIAHGWDFGGKINTPLVMNLDGSPLKLLADNRVLNQPFFSIWGCFLAK